MHTFKTSILLIALLHTGLASAATIDVKPGDDWIAKIKSARAGDVVEFTAGKYITKGYSYEGRTVEIQGTRSSPIRIRSKEKRKAILDGGGANQVLRFENSSHIVFEGFVVTNPSPYGIDGRVTYQNAPESRHYEGIAVSGRYENFKIVGNLFREIATRGISQTCSGTCDGFVVERNIFTHVGHDTASGDVNAMGGTGLTFRENMFAGSVDGVVFAGKTGGGHIIERNVCLNGQREDCYDLKAVNMKGTGPTTHIRDNVIYTKDNYYTGITVQNESNKVNISGNFLKGTVRANAQIVVHGRGHREYVGDGVRDVEISNNYLMDNSDDGFRVYLAKTESATHLRSSIANVVIRDNFLENVGNAKILCCDTQYFGNNEKPTAAHRKPFEDLEASIFSSLCNEFSESEIVGAAEMSRASRKGFNPKSLQGVCSGTNASSAGSSQSTGLPVKPEALTISVSPIR